MLDRFRDLLRRLELPQDVDGDLVYRIIDDDLNAVEVTAAQYAMWRMQNDVTKRAIVADDTVEEVKVRTTFSIMPENKGYKPFGTSAYALPLYDPLIAYSQRYDTWREAEQGHRHTLERVRRDAAVARLGTEKADALAGTSGEVHLAISADLPAMFQVNVLSENEVSVQTPLLMADGTRVELTISEEGKGYDLTGPAGVSPGDTDLIVIEVRVEQVEELCKSLGVSEESGKLVCRANDASEIGSAILRLAQAVACFSYLTRSNSH